MFWQPSTREQAKPIFEVAVKLKFGSRLKTFMLMTFSLLLKDSILSPPKDLS